MSSIQRSELRIKMLYRGTRSIDPCNPMLGVSVSRHRRHLKIVELNAIPTRAQPEHTMLVR